jgi:hypothetical protein
LNHVLIVRQTFYNVNNLFDLFIDVVGDFKARSITLYSALKMEMADSNRREYTCCPKTAADASLSPSLEPSVHITEYSDGMDLIAANLKFA